MIIRTIRADGIDWVSKEDFYELQQMFFKYKEENSSLKYELEGYKRSNDRWQKYFETVDTPASEEIKQLQVTISAYRKKYSELKAENDVYRKALESIFKNTCCDNCGEAGLVAGEALKLENTQLKDTLNDVYSSTYQWVMKEETATEIMPIMKAIRLKIDNALKGKK